MKKLIKPLLFVAILAFGISAYAYLTTSKKVPKKTRGATRAVPVEVIAARPADQPVTVAARGTVVPARSVVVLPEVSGRITFQSPGLVPGGHVKKGQPLIRIDDRDHTLALQQQRASVAQAELQLATERGRHSAARAEWALIKDEVRPTAEGKKLALRQVQLQTAHAALDSAKSGLARAELLRSRTVIRAPFDAMVTEELVDRGQVVSPATRVATLVATDTFWVRVSVPVDQLRWIRIPGITRGPGSPVKVVQRVAGAPIEREGKVIRLMGELDPRGRMARLLVAVKDPLGLANREQRAARRTRARPRNTGGEHAGKDAHAEEVRMNASRLPLLLGASVQVTIEGLRLNKSSFKLPRRALRDNDLLWVMTAVGRLGLRPVQRIWSTDSHVFVRGELTPGDLVITSDLTAPVEGMAVEAAPSSAPGGVKGENQALSEVSR